MSQIDPLVFGAVVLALVGFIVIAPRFFSRDGGPTADDVFLDSLPSAYDKRITVPGSAPVAMSVTPPEQQATPPGAPRAAAPTRQPVASSAPPSDGLAPLKLPAQ
jgi:dienelactone hydrolase